MFSWLFKPSCPCDHHAKAWIEERLAYLAEEFEDSAFSGRPVVLPTPRFFPIRYDASKESVFQLVTQVCEYMDVDTDSLHIRIADMGSENHHLVNDQGQAIGMGAAGTYEKIGYGEFEISIDRVGMYDPLNLVGTIAHELAHVRLMGEGRMDGSEFDNEILTDLTVIHFGLGIFLANTPRAWDGAYRKWPGTDFRKPEYMNAPMYGWALAHLAHFREEAKPAWAKYLNSSARTNLFQGIRYLNATGDSSYRV
jgi:hypothetical protein